MRDRQICIECGKKSPETETNYTLISAQFGWRLSRRRAENGDFIVEWRCPDCWRSHKKREEASGADPSASRPKVPLDLPPPRTRSSRPPAGGSTPSRSSKPPPSTPSTGPRPRRS